MVVRRNFVANLADSAHMNNDMDPEQKPRSQKEQLF
ncbi:hypothetical protein CDHC01_1154 [Corynebacterium diphtheriae HC01]|nr:hypothetical protein CD31A_1236 [Corynebacterium diphtheriae 31A]AEX44220.1 hypothetical protein CD241_1155 [Corynebacterium diphtheriae 241]AEX48726.1 hypothetical protein CDBH8_1203 [Corynebacterium diphtheriae BH8]AEX69859.1 hypothetical protein CDPW8_1204 [Corynebacterium diphtheriae PW8]AEX72119.1 hypothetical protein CDCE8392_1126 [Corynebacterium diphtheriae CDCE 8392]AEX74405.1 hypothetical protein CDHC01_1154 [Corynebacterium diphtheriae HC01]AEX78859.1 hypothetical protein CDHC03